MPQIPSRLPIQLSLGFPNLLFVVVQRLIWLHLIHYTLSSFKESPKAREALCSYPTNKVQTQNLIRDEWVENYPYPVHMGQIRSQRAIKAWVGSKSDPMEFPPLSSKKAIFCTVWKLILRTEKQLRTVNFDSYCSTAKKIIPSLFIKKWTNTNHSGTSVD